MVDMPQQTTVITDSSTLAALLGSDAYRQASGTAESSESASDGASDVTFALQWLLKTPIDVWSLPPTAFYAQHDEQACVVSDGKPVAVHLVPIGIVQPQARCIIGNGCVVNIFTLFEEMEALKKNTITAENR